jgi:hypothetical protein
VLENGAVVGRIFKVHAAPVGTPWMWTLAFGHHEDRTPTHGYAHSEFGAAAIKQLESDMYDLRLEFIRAFNECENKVGHYRQLWEQKRERVKLLENQIVA